MSTLKVVQCWDDGVSKDIPLIEILRKHKAKATFNLNYGLHKEERSAGWIYKDTEVSRLGLDEMKEVYEGFVIANHTVSHPHLEQIPADKAYEEISDGRKRLQDFFNQEVLGFAYPFGTYNDEVMELVKKAGHVYARTCKNVDHPIPAENPMAFHSNCHFLAEDFWERFERAREGGVFYFWGHSYEIINDEMWADFEEKIARISQDETCEWLDVVDLFA